MPSRYIPALAVALASTSQPAQRPVSGTQAASQIAQAHPERQKALKRLQALVEDTSVDLRTTDEVHFQQHGSRCHAVQRGMIWRGATARREISVLP